MYGQVLSWKSHDIESIFSKKIICDSPLLPDGELSEFPHNRVLERVLSRATNDSTSFSWRSMFLVWCFVGIFGSFVFCAACKNRFVVEIVFILFEDIFQSTFNIDVETFTVSNVMS